MAAPIYKGGAPFFKPFLRFVNSVIFPLQVVGGGAPVNGVSGTGAAKAGIGSGYVDNAAGAWYHNVGTKASPTWTQFASAGVLSPELTQDNVTAGTTQTQAGATALTGQLVRVATVANNGDGVLLPASAVGLIITIENNGANPMKVYGKGADTINSITNTTGLFQGVGTTASYCCTVAGNWIVSLTSLYGPSPVAITASGAIQPRAPQFYIINKAGIAAMTVAAPTAVTDDGIEIVVTSDSANAHTIAFTGGTLDTGSAAATNALFNANKGASLSVVAFNARFKVIAANGVAFS